MVKAYLIFVVVVLFCLLVNVNSALIEVGSADLTFTKGDTVELGGSGISPSISVAEINTTPTPPKILLDILPAKESTAVKLVHVVQSDKNAVWNPANYYFSLNSELQKGQFVEFLIEEQLFRDQNFFKKKLVCEIDRTTGKEVCIEKIVVETKRFYYKNSRLVHWNIGDKNTFLFGSDFNLSKPKLFFNSITRDFSKELEKGFKPVSLSIDGNLVSLKFSTNKTATTGTVVLNDLVTQSVAICTSPDNNVTWFDGNTYFINSDLNVNVSNCRLTIQPGAVVKFKSGSLTYIRIDTNGELKAQGTPTKKIVFTSMDDDSVGEIISGSDGVPSIEDYWGAIKFDFSYPNSPIILPDTNDFFDLNIGYANSGINFSSGAVNSFGSVHDCIFHHIGLNSSVSLGIVGTVNAVYNNVFENSTGPSLYLEGGTLKSFYNNKIQNNNSYTGYSVKLISAITKIVSFYDNTFSDSTGIKLDQSDITNLYNNNFSNIAPYTLTVSGEFASVTNLNNNNFSNNSATVISISDSGTIASIFGNNFSNNTGEAINNSGTIENLYNNVFKNNSLTTVELIHNSKTITSIYNNLFTNNSSGDSAIILNAGNWDTMENSCTVNALISNLYNNTFFNTYAGGGYATIDGTSTDPTSPESCSTYTNIKNNLFTYDGTSSSIACYDVCEFTNVSKNGYWQANSGLGAIVEPIVINLLQNPFLNDKSDRNFLLNAYGLAELDNNGVSVGADLFFNQKTLNPSNALDRGIRGVGFHYDQNAPYVKILSPNNGGVFNKTVTIDFNVESGYGTPAGLQTALFYSSLDKSVLYSIVNKHLSLFDCNGLTLYFTCSYVWNTLGVDGNVFLALWSQDTNGIGKTFNDRNIQILNFQSQAGTKRFFSSGDNRVNQQFGVLNKVQYSAQNSVKFPLDSSDSGNRFFTWGDYRVLLPTKELLTGIGILLGIIILIGVGVWWYREK